MHLKLYSFSRKKYKKVYRKVFKSMKKNNANNLILDLRYNGGGSLENAYGLLSYLMDKETNQGGNHRPTMHPGPLVPGLG
jgi:C-terminal processing protease CtpA/Prc